MLNIFFTAGYPTLNSTMDVISSLQNAGVDIIELGIPYSDPLADGPVIQESSVIALNNGMSLSTLHVQISDMRKHVQVPVILMGYLNPLLQYGFEKFCKDFSAAGVDGLIIPDLPVDEFETEYQHILKKYGLDFIFLVTPETSESRIRRLDALSSGFIYAVASSSITGSEQDLDALEIYLKRLNEMNLKNPLLVGFGIKDKQSFDAVCKYAAGGIIGSEFIRQLTQSSDHDAIETFISKIRN